MTDSWIVYLPIAILIAVNLRGVYLYFAGCAKLKDLRISIGSLGLAIMYFGLLSYSTLEPSLRNTNPKMTGIIAGCVGLGILVYSLIANRKQLETDMEDVNKSKWGS